MAAQLGKDAALLFQTDGVAGSAGWTVLANCTSVTFDMQQDEADVTVRGSGGWAAKVGTLKNGKISFDMVWDTTDSNFSTLATAFLDNTVLGFACLDRIDGAGATGLMADMVVLNFSRDEPLSGPIMAKVEVSVTYSTDTPQWVTGGTAAWV